MRTNEGDKVNFVAAYYFFVGGIFALLAVAALVVPLAAVALGESEFLARLPGWFLGSTLLIVAVFLGGLALIFLVFGWGLWQLRTWSRTGAMILAVFQIPFIPIGTVAGGVILYILLQDQVRELFWVANQPFPPR
ncbi:MAG: hypothetical protein R2844_03800 [Caldilineales bacterium]